MIPKNDVWRLAICSNKSFGLQPSNLDYFKEYFRGKQLPAEWIPPEYKIKGKSYKIKDFISWMLCAPVVSDKARHALTRVVDGFAEFKLMGTFRGKRYFVMNVYFTADCLDFESSDVMYAPGEAHRILDIQEYAFRKEAIPDAQLFMEANHPGDISFQRVRQNCLADFSRWHYMNGDPGDVNRGRQCTCNPCNRLIIPACPVPR